jgi:hypothetical protein
MNADERDDFNATQKAFEQLCLCATGISTETQGAPCTWEQMMASIAFSKLALTSTSILRLMPNNPFSSEVHGFQFWDLGSICSLSRNLVEIGLTMHYLLLPAVDDEERKLRRHVWEYHGQLERVKIIRLASPGTQAFRDMEEQAERQRNSLSASPCFQNLPRDLRRRIIHGERAKLLTNEEICDYAGVSPNFYAAMFKYGSNHTHSSPYSFSSMDRLDPSTGRGFEAVNIALTIGVGFLAVGIRDYLQMFPAQLEKLTADERTQIATWLGVVKWDLNAFFAGLQT